MQLLLLLSAILSALTGAVTGTRAEAPQRVASSSVAVVVQAEARSIVSVAVRPAAVLPTVRKNALAPLAALIFVSALPPFASRRRE